MENCRPARQQFLSDAEFCWTCGQGGPLTPHEMLRGSFREVALPQRCTWLAVCWQCNSEELTSAGKWPLVRQQAVKWIYDRDYFDLVKTNLLHDRAPGAITFTEVIPHICRLLDDSIQ